MYDVIFIKILKRYYSISASYLHAVTRNMYLRCENDIKMQSIKSFVEALHPTFTSKVHTAYSFEWYISTNNIIYMYVQLYNNIIKYHLHLFPEDLYPSISIGISHSCCFLRIRVTFHFVTHPYCTIILYPFIYVGLILMICLSSAIMTHVCYFAPKV